MTVLPNRPEQYGAEALFDPADAIGAQGDGDGLPEVPPAVLLGYQKSLTATVEERADSTVTLVRSQVCHRLTDEVEYVPVHEAGVGAPVTAMVAENAIAAGAEAVVMLGGGAALQRVPPDAALLPTEAIRDEGVSYHYLPDEEPVGATPGLVDRLEERLSGAGFPTRRGATWTTSAIYRETVPEIERYRSDGVLSLCMESAALWAVCRYRGVATATVHEVGDYLDPEGWEPEAPAERGLREMLPPSSRRWAARSRERENGGRAVPAAAQSSAGCSRRPTAGRVTSRSDASPSMS